MTVLELYACVTERWSPGIGDPTLAGWLTVAAYLLTAFLSLAVWHRLAHQRARVFWGVLVLLLMLLAINKQLDMQSALTAAGKCLAQAQGWYSDRRVVQAGFIAILLALVLLGLGLAMRALRGTLIRNFLALLGLATVLSFVMIRAVSFHRFDSFIGARNFGISNNFILENAGLILIAANAAMILRRARARRAVDERLRQDRPSMN